MMGFSYDMIMLLSTKESPTLSLLEEWERVLGKWGMVRREGEDGGVRGEQQQV